MASSFVNSFDSMTSATSKKSLEEPGTAFETRLAGEAPAELHPISGGSALRWPPVAWQLPFKENCVFHEFSLDAHCSHGRQVKGASPVIHMCHAI